MMAKGTSARLVGALLAIGGFALTGASAADYGQRRADWRAESVRVGTAEYDAGRSDRLYLEAERRAVRTRVGLFGLGVGLLVLAASASRRPEPAAPHSPRHALGLTLALSALALGLAILASVLPLGDGALRAVMLGLPLARAPLLLALLTLAHRRGIGPWRPTSDPGALRALLAALLLVPVAPITLLATPLVLLGRVPALAAPHLSLLGLAWGRTRGS